MSLKPNLFKLKDLENIPILKTIIFKHKKKIKNHSIDLIIRQIIRDIINEMVKDIIINTKKNIQYVKPKNIKDIYRSKVQLVNFSSKMSNFDLSIKLFLKSKMYNHKNVLKRTQKGRKIVQFLFSKIKKNPNKFIKKNLLINISKERLVCDFIAGMTDRYAINLYNSIK